MFSDFGKHLQAGLTITIATIIWLSAAPDKAAPEVSAISYLPATVVVEMWELQPNGNRGEQRCINYSGARSGNWGCTAYCSQGGGYPCTNPDIHPPPVPKPAGQSAWVYPFSSNQVIVAIDGSAAYDG